MQGVLVIAHGSSNPRWVALVDEAVNQVDVGVPIVTSFLEMVEGRSIQQGARQLEEEGVTSIIAVPLFVSSGSTHIQEIRYLLGLDQELELQVEEEPLRIHAKVEFVSPMDDHPLIVACIEERVKELSISPREEVVVLVGHGSKLSGFYELWESMMRRVAAQLKQKLGFQDVHSVTLLPDQLQSQLEEIRHNRILVVPLFLSEGYFTKKVIPSRMGGVDCVYNGKTYLPDLLVSEWIKAAVMEKRDQK